MNVNHLNYSVNSNLDMLEELYDLFQQQGNINVAAYFRTIRKIKKYYDFQLLNRGVLKGSYDKLEILELIHYLENE